MNRKIANGISLCVLIAGLSAMAVGIASLVSSAIAGIDFHLSAMAFVIIGLTGWFAGVALARKSK